MLIEDYGLIGDLQAGGSRRSRREPRLAGARFTAAGRGL